MPRAAKPRPRVARRQPARRPVVETHPKNWDEAAYLIEVEAAYKRLRVELPEIDPQSLYTIVASVLRPFGTGKRFLMVRDANGRIRVV